MAAATPPEFDVWFRARRVLRRVTPWRERLAQHAGDRTQPFNLDMERAERIELSFAAAEAELIADMAAKGLPRRVCIHDLTREIGDEGPTVARRCIRDRALVNLLRARSDSSGCVTLECILVTQLWVYTPAIASAAGGPPSKPPRNVPEARRRHPMSIIYDPDQPGPNWPDGIYAAHIESAEEKLSKAGNRMIEFTFVCFHKCLGITRVWEHVVVPKQLWKLRALAAAIGRQDAYASGTFRAADYLGSHLELELNTEQAKGYPPRNVIVEFLPVPGGPFGPVPEVDEFASAGAGAEAED